MKVVLTSKHYILLYFIVSAMTWWLGTLIVWSSGLL